MRQVADIRHHYERLNRIDAIKALEAALFEAENNIEADPARDCRPLGRIRSLPGPGSHG